MIAALAIGRKGSSGLQGKNHLFVLGRPLAAYPMLAARDCELIDRLYLSTDCDVLKAIGRDHDATIIERPDWLATNEALGEDAFKHGYAVIREEAGELEFVVLLMCNAPTITSRLIAEAIERLRADPEADSAVSVSRYNMWSPIRARRKGADGYLKPFVPFETFGNPRDLNCDRDSQGDVWFADMGVSVVRPRCLEAIEDGLLPQKWMGQKILPVENWGGLDVDYAWQIGMIEFWLREHGFSYEGMKT